MRRLAVACAIAALFTAVSARAEFRNRILAEGDVFQVRKNGVTITCGRISGKWIAGSLSKGAFMSFAQAIKNKRALARTAAPAKKEKLLAAVAALKAKQAAQNPTCKSGPPDEDGDGGGDPDPTPTPSTGNFDSAGNVTAKGKAAFGIPSNLSGNITTGRSRHTAYTCASCHSEKTGTSFSELKAAIATESQMDFIADTATDGDIANIIAYLNRFRMN